MALTKGTLKAMIREYDGFDLSDEELEMVLPELNNYLAEAEKLRELDLSDVKSARLLKTSEGGEI